MPKSRVEIFLSALINGESVDIEPVSRIEKYLSELCKKGIGGAGTGSWNNLTDRPFGETVNHETYDFKITPEVYFDGLGFRWYKFSELIPTEEQLLTAEFVESRIDSTGKNITNTETPTVERFLLSNEEVNGFTTTMGAYVVARKAGTIVTDLATVDVPETGIYFGWNTESVPADAQLVVSVKYEEVIKLPVKYIPDELYKEIDNRIDAYIEEALGGEY